MVAKSTIKTNTYFYFLAETFKDNWPLCKQAKKHAHICFAAARKQSLKCRIQKCAFESFTAQLNGFTSTKKASQYVE